MKRLWLLPAALLALLSGLSVPPADADMVFPARLEVIDPPVPRSVRVAEAPGEGISVLQHARRSRSAEAYRELAGNIEAML